jgi:hypothetical protein
VSRRMSESYRLRKSSLHKTLSFRYFNSRLTSTALKYIFSFIASVNAITVQVYNTNS